MKPLSPCRGLHGNRQSFLPQPNSEDAYLYVEWDGASSPLPKFPNGFSQGLKPALLTKPHNHQHAKKTVRNKCQLPWCIATSPEFAPWVRWNPCRFANRTAKARLSNFHPRKFLLPFWPMLPNMFVPLLRNILTFTKLKPVTFFYQTISTIPKKSRLTPFNTTIFVATRIDPSRTA